MTRSEITQRFPYASEAFIAANLSNSILPAPVPPKQYYNQLNLDPEKLYASYLRTGSVHRTAKLFNTCGETVKKYLLKGGKKLNKSKWTNYEIELLKRFYSNPNGFDIVVIAKTINRTHASIACKADDLGLCSDRGKHIRTPLAEKNHSDAQKKLGSRPEIKSARSKSSKEWHSLNEHPRGMLGKNHTQAAKEAIRNFHTGKKLPIEQTIKSMKTRLLRYGTLTPKINRGSWKASWRIIGGIRKFYRSKWEANYARYLEFQKLNGIIKSWQHECETFWFNGVKRGCVSYLPDFKVINNDDTIEFHEVKGWMDNQSKTKIKRMAKYYPEIKLRVFDSKWYRLNRLRLSGLIKDWEN